MNLLEELRALDPRDPGRWPLPWTDGDASPPADDPVDELARQEAAANAAADADAAPGTFAEVDFRALHAFANLAAALWMAHDGPGWLRSLDYTKLPVRTEGT